MTEKTRRRDLFRPLQLVGLSLLCGVFAGAVTVIATGAFTQKVMRMVDKGTYAGIPPWNLAFIVTGVIFIAALLILSILILAVDPADFAKPHDRPVLYDAATDDAATWATGAAGDDASGSAASGSAASGSAGETSGSETSGSDAPGSDDGPETSGSGSPSAS
ncbi:MAG: hypothetical protein JST33_08500 [Actinobacteria bacterium]|nr:hypothetical protein [Actinomycetota bacterium]